MSSSGYTMAHPADLDGETSYTFTCGKIDAGIAVLIGCHAHLIEFPSLLLPPGCEPGSIVSITCARDHVAEKAQADSFWELQTKIFNQFGVQYPKPPNLRLRSVTQTSVTLEWDKLELAQCKLLSLSIWKNGQRLGTLPNPTNNTSTKLSGLDLDTEYNFHLVMMTTGGTFNSQKISLKTHSLNDTSGINVCFGIILPEELREQSEEALKQLDGTWSDKIQIDTTHFVCTMAYHPQHAQNKTSQPNTFPSLSYQRALQLSIPVVQPSWLLACLHERKMVPIAAHYLGVQPPALSSSPSTASPTGTVGRPRSGSKTAARSSTPISPKPSRVESDSSTDSGNQRHERAMSAPENIRMAEGSRKLTDQVDKSAAPSLAAIEETVIDTDPSSIKQVQEETDGLENVDFNSEPSHVGTRTLVSDPIHETESEKTFKLGPKSVPSSSLNQPTLPTPPTASSLSDILKENVHSPAENDGSSSKPLSISPTDQRDYLARDPPETMMRDSGETVEETPKPGSGASIPTSQSNPASFQFSSKPHSSTVGHAGLNTSDHLMGDDADDDPFSAASPTISNTSPSVDEMNFANRLKLDPHQIVSGSLLSPPVNSLSPSIPSPSTLGEDEDNTVSLAAVAAQDAAPPVEEADVDQPPPDASLTGAATNPSSSPATNENSVDFFEDVLVHSSEDEPDLPDQNMPNNHLMDDSLVHSDTPLDHSPPQPLSGPPLLGHADNHNPGL